MVSIRQCLQSASEQLADSSDSPRLDAEVLLSHALGCDASHLIAWPDKQLEENQLSLYANLIKQRIKGIPVAYLKGTKEFWSRSFRVNEHTLIPRPETELLIEYVLQHFDNAMRKVADLGTGSGVIAVTLACERPHWQLTAGDINRHSLAMAEANARLHDADNIDFRQGNWLDVLEDRQHIIVSNPPYIASADPHLTRGDVRFEPSHALVSGDSGLDDIAHLCQHAPGFLEPGGWLIVEHGHDQQAPVRKLFEKDGYEDIVQQQDLAGNPRLTAGRIA